MTRDDFIKEFGNNCCAGCNLADSVDWTVGYGACNPVDSNCWWREGLKDYTMPCELLEKSKEVEAGVHGGQQRLKGASINYSW